MTRESKRLVRDLTSDLTQDDIEINDGQEHQARDGTNLRTMADAEAEAQQEMRAQLPPVRTYGLVRSLWRLGTIPLRMPFWAARAAVATIKRSNYLSALKA